MKFLAAIFFLVITATAASAAVPGPHSIAGLSNPGAPITMVQYRHRRHCCVMGPAYGWPGEPLGPAYWTNQLWMSDPQVCGPGACQDNPWY